MTLLRPCSWCDTNESWTLWGKPALTFMWLVTFVPYICILHFGSQNVGNLLQLSLVFRWPHLIQCRLTSGLLIWVLNETLLRQSHYYRSWSKQSIFPMNKLLLFVFRNLARLGNWKELRTTFYFCVFIQRSTINRCLNALRAVKHIHQSSLCWI